MGRQKERDEFIAAMTKEGLPVTAAAALLRAEKTLHRYAELECSSEAADRDRVPCPGIKKEADCLCDKYDGEHETVMRIEVRGARIQAGIVELLDQVNAKMYPGRDWQEEGLPHFAAVFNGDPRGPAILVKVPSGRTDDWGQRGICVP